MPEGHTIHRLARLHRQWLGGQVVRASSPQGRFSQGARVLDGRVLEDVHAYGKHLFYDFGDASGEGHGASAGGRSGPDGSGDVTLHVHLGLFGRFRAWHGDAPAPTAGTRLVLSGDHTIVHLAGATTVELTDADGVTAVRARLGPDPLHTRADPEQFAANLARRSVPLGQALLDQGVVAGIGNVYRSEVLFLERLDPLTPAHQLDRATARRVWDRTVALLQRGERSGRIVTVDDPPATGPRRWVYQRSGQPCLACGTIITAYELGGRKMYACPRCQAPRGKDSV